MKLFLLFALFLVVLDATAQMSRPLTLPEAVVTAVRSKCGCKWTYERTDTSEVLTRNEDFVVIDWKNFRLIMPHGIYQMQRYVVSAYSPVEYIYFYDGEIPMMLTLRYGSNSKYINHDITLSNNEEANNRN